MAALELAAALAAAARPEAAGVFITLTAARARREAEAADQRRRAGQPRGPVDGLLVSIKDLIDMAGVPTTRGSLAWVAEPALQDAAVVQRLSAAGAVCVGKTNLSEFAFSGLGLNPHFGTPCNPHSPAGQVHVCGGSSSGAAASVALGLCAAAIGTDTSGSVRVPAAFTGLYGYRGSQALYPMEGVAGLSDTLDTLGVITRSAREAMQVHAVISGRPVPNASTQAADIVVVDEFLEASSGAPCRNAQRLAARWADRGWRVRHAAVPQFTQTRALFARHGTLVAAEAAHRYGELLGSDRGGLIDPHVRARLLAAQGFLASDYIALMAHRRRLMDELAGTWGDAIFLFPTTPDTAPRLGDVEGSGFAAANARALSHCMVGSYLDMPGMAMPSGVGEAGLPTSVLLSTRQGEDDRLLALCMALEEQPA